MFTFLHFSLIQPTDDVLDAWKTIAANEGLIVISSGEEETDTEAASKADEDEDVVIVEQQSQHEIKHQILTGEHLYLYNIHVVNICTCNM